MKKRITKLMALLLTTSMLVPMTACSTSKKSASDEHVLNIWCWNDEFQSRFNDYYPEVKKVSKDKSKTYLKDGTVVKWTINENKDNNYQNKLDEALQEQDEKDDNDKIDIFLIEADYALKYVNSSSTLDVVKDIGLTKKDLGDQYKYTKDIVTSKGVQKATSWQATPGLFAYRRTIAKQVLGTDDPKQVQEALGDWNKFNEVAGKAKTAGYQMLSGYDDSFRVYSNNVKQPWVKGDTVTVDENIMNWVKQTKEFTDKGYNNKTSLWSDAWSKDQGPDGKVFGFFYSTWGINFTLMKNSLANPDGKAEVGNGAYGDWAVCEGPAPYYWGGTWLCAAKGTDDKKEIKNIMLKLTCDKENMKKMTENPDIQDYTNTQSGMEEIAQDPKFSSSFLGGQNHVALFSESAKKIDMSNTSKYDQGCNEKIQTAMKDYFDGKVSLDKAKKNFETSIKEVYPNIKKVKWPKD
ncbi:type 2 periplasmic-binding domain-containing protein [Lachnobacterium bovis]|uniref:ABC-type glycerol-3-phosphate transport system, substrate-binding protein n=1 Tax=Lachnobacterium bovis DSM 14045 TaxID=1122142 RepID=A0A1H3LVT6_9FIRM|nr:ABC transporter substrate-binding protein [Lachnobacterium bovis]SDY68149.1 ABC-type glycerol-3-phosphate transport system, substrate-binding protein [Lachnobacterium bovis DSM 14045]